MAYNWGKLICLIFCVLLFVCLFVLLFSATSAAYGGSQARGWTGVAAAGPDHSHSNTESELCLWSTLQLTAILNT